MGGHQRYDLLQARGPRTNTAFDAAGKSLQYLFKGVDEAVGPFGPDIVSCRGML
jgi:hypothetical protein